MIKLKDFLFEVHGDGTLEDAKQFLEYIRSGDWIIPQKKGTNLYRGTTRPVVLGVKEEYEGGRDPMSTNKSIQNIVDVIGKVRYSDWPQRGRSRFASTNTGDAGRYGSVHYVFPRKGSKIVSFDSDAYIGYFGSKMNYDLIKQQIKKVNKNIKENFFEILKEEFGDKVFNIVKAYYNALSGKGLKLLKNVCESMSLERQKNIIQNTHENIREKKLFRKMGYDVVRGFEDIFYYLHFNFIEKLHKYFSEGTIGVKPRSSEVIMRGDVLHAYSHFVDRFCFFDDEEKEWKLKDRFK